VGCLETLPPLSNERPLPLNELSMEGLEKLDKAIRELSGCFGSLGRLIDWRFSRNGLGHRLETTLAVEPRLTELVRLG
jgi:hypothetical protein